MGQNRQDSRKIQIIIWI